MQPKISVIVPVYKAEKYLHHCVDSILAQTFTDFELILVDDGSPDNSGAICDEYAAKDNRVKVIHKENGGASDARNNGLDNATGEIVCFVDSDDYVEPEFLENFGDCHADITIQSYYVRNYNEEQYHYYTINNAEFNNDSTTDLMNAIHIAKNTGYLWTRAFKRKIIEKNNLRLNTKYRVREDEEFIWRYMLKCNSFATIDKGAYYYDVPDFSSKYSFINIETDFECTVSIIENCAKFCECYQHPHIVNNINRLASLVLNSYRKKEYSVQDTKEYINKFRELYKKVKGDKLLTMKSKIVYNIIGAHTPLFIHKLYNIILKFY